MKRERKIRFFRPTRTSRSTTAIATSALPAAAARPTARCRPIDVSEQHFSDADPLFDEIEALRRLGAPRARRWSTASPRSAPWRSPSGSARPWRRHDACASLLVAGEASGDLHGAALRRAAPSARVRISRWSASAARACAPPACACWSTPSTSRRWASPRPSARSGGSSRRLSHAWCGGLDEARPDLVVLVDYPEFNLRLAKQAKRRGIPVFYFVAPQVWAWRRGGFAPSPSASTSSPPSSPSSPASTTTATGSRWRSSSAIRCSTSSPPTRSREETRARYGIAARPAAARAPSRQPQEGGRPACFAPMCDAAARLAPDGWQPIAALAESLAPADLEAALAGGAIPVPVAHNDTYNARGRGRCRDRRLRDGDRRDRPLGLPDGDRVSCVATHLTGSLAAWSTCPGSACPTSSSNAKSSRSCSRTTSPLPPCADAVRDVHRRHGEVVTAIAELRSSPWAPPARLARRRPGADA